MIKANRSSDQGDALGSNGQASEGANDAYTYHEKDPVGMHRSTLFVSQPPSLASLRYEMANDVSRV